MSSIEERLNRALTALDELKRWNRIHNDLEAYLFEVARWGQGETDEQPKPEDFGVYEEKP